MLRQLLFITWALPVCLYVLGFPKDSVFLATTAVSLFSITIVVLSPRRFLIVLPFVTLLSPLTGLINVMGAELVFTDISFIVAAAFTVCYAMVHLSQLLSGRLGLFFVLVAVFTLSAIVGVLTETLITSKPLLYLAQLIVLYYFCLRFIRGFSDFDEVVSAWLSATFLACIVLIFAYLAGINLDSLKSGDTDAAIPVNISALYRATFFYAGFHFVLGIAVIMSFIKLMVEGTTRGRAVAVCYFIIASVGLGAMFNKTAIMGAMIGVLAASAVLWNDEQHKAARSRMIWFFLVGIGGVVFLGREILGAVDEAQISLALERWLGTSSWSTRIEIYDRALRLWFSEPLRVVAGFGPSFLDNAGNPSIAAEFKISAITGYEEGTVDSGWISYAIELGIFGAILIATALMRGIASSFQLLNSDEIGMVERRGVISLFCCLIFLVVALGTQMLGYTKTSWLPFEIVIVAMVSRRLVQGGGTGSRWLPS